MVSPAARAPFSGSQANEPQAVDAHRPHTRPRVAQVRDQKRRPLGLARAPDGECRPLRRSRIGGGEKRRQRCPRFTSERCDSN